MRPAHEPVAPVSASHAQLPRRLSTVAVEQPETQSGFVTKEEFETLRTEVHSVRGAFDGVGGVSEERVRTMLRENNRTWEEQLRKSEQEWTNKVADLEEALKLRLRVLEEHIGGLSPPAGNAGVASTLQLSVQADLGRVPILNLTSDTPSSHQFLGKRAHDTTNLAAYLAETPTADGIQNADINDSPVQKRARIEPAHLVSAQMEEDDSLIAIEPRTPSPPRMPTVSFKTPILPRTPSPSHQGVLPDNSMTPKVGSDYFANPPPFSVSGKKRKKSGPIEQLPYPIFSTTPKPTEPTSPTTDAPSSLSRGRNQGPTMLTPGRHRSEPATRAVSDAHKGLSSITESDEPRSEPAGMPSDTPTPTFLGPELGDPPASSPRLSASPTLRESAFAYHPFPANPSSRSFPAAVPRSRNRTSSSPARDYMSVALHGLNNPSDSPSAQATPGHRTMLGTERYRDTRFGDVPVFQWGTPSVDLGPRTPSLARRDS